MQSQSTAVTKLDALVELLVLIEEGRALLARQIPNRQELATADVQRATWGLQVKKVLRRLFGESAGQVRFSGAYASTAMVPAPRLADEVRAFQDHVLEQLSNLDRLALLLRKMA
jgi:hypothetical protein